MIKNLLILLCILTLLSCKKANQSKPKQVSTGFQILTLVENPKNEDNKDYPNIGNRELLGEGNSEEQLMNSTINFYREYWVGKKKNFSPNEKALEILENLLENFSDKIKVKKISETFAVITRPEVGISELYDVSDVEDIWYLQENRWIPFFDFQNKFYKVNLFDLNGDKFPDVIIQGGCCDSTKYNVILAIPEGGYKHIQDIEIIGDVKEELQSDCRAKITATDYHNSELQKKVRFNCTKNKFEIF